MMQILDYIALKIKQHDQKVFFDSYFKNAKDHADIERLIRQLEQKERGGLFK
jgi:hypothetical protein